MENVSKRLKALRSEYNLNQKEFGSRLGITNSHVSAIEKEKVSPSQALLKLICKEFRVSELWLISGVGPMFEEELAINVDNIMSDSASRFNKIFTKDDENIRGRISPIYKMFVDMLDVQYIDDELRKQQYYDMLFKMFYHINGYLNFYKNKIDLNDFEYPDDITEILFKDIQGLKQFFKEE